MFLSACRRQHVVVTSVRRSFGVMDNVMGFAGKQMEKKRDGAFAEMTDGAFIVQHDWRNLPPLGQAGGPHSHKTKCT